MNFVQFAYKNGLRNKRRTLLTVCSIAFSLFVFVTLLNIVKILAGPDTNDMHLRLVVRRATSLGEQVPASYLPKIKAVPGVRLAMPLTWFQGVLSDDESSFFANFSCDPSVIFDMYQEIVIAPEQRDAFIRERTAAIVGKLTADRFNWKLGQRIHLVSQIYTNEAGAPVELELIIRGIYTTTVAGVDANFFFHNDYFDEATGREGKVGTYWVKVNNTSDIPNVAAAIDSMFKNTAAETKTETEKAFAASFQAMLGNFKMLLSSISAIVLTTILLVISSTMAMSIRERAPEIAVLKTLGYKRGLILFLLMSESAAIALAGGLSGMVGARIFYALFDMKARTKGMIPFFQIDLPTMGIGMLTAFAIGILSAAIPALLASRQNVLTGLRQIR